MKWNKFSPKLFNSNKHFVIKNKIMNEKKINMLQKTIIEKDEKLSEYNNELKEAQDELTEKIKEY